MTFSEGAAGAPAEIRVTVAVPVVELLATPAITETASSRALIANTNRVIHVCRMSYS
jgi:hypothetical protein